MKFSCFLLLSREWSSISRSHNGVGPAYHAREAMSVQREFCNLQLIYCAFSWLPFVFKPIIETVEFSLRRFCAAERAVLGTSGPCGTESHSCSHPVC